MQHAKRAPLFRQEVLEARSARLWGDVIISQPLAFPVLTGFFVIALASVLLFAGLNGYARKETTLGYLAPDRGIIQIRGPKQAIIDKLHVQEGDEVKAGAPLVTINAEQRNGDGKNLDTSILNSLTQQIVGLEERIALQDDLQEIEQSKLASEITGLTAEIANLQTQINQQHRLIQLANENFVAILEGVDKGWIAKRDAKARQEQLLIEQQKLANFEQQLAASHARLEQAKIREKQLPIDQAERLSQLKERLSDLNRQYAEMEGRSANRIIAPIDGIVTAIQGFPGMTIDVNTQILTILPEGSALQAQLFVPTRAIGFIAEGQDVRLLYDAFDYRRFGAKAGTVRTVSATIIDPRETAIPVAVQEPVYRVTVDLHSQEVDAYGRNVPLQAGMALKADIILEHRSIIAWLFDPLLSWRRG